MKKKKTNPTSLSRDVEDHIEKDYEDQESTRLDIVRDTVNDVNKVIQSPKIFITINIVLLLVIIILGRIVIHFIEPPPQPEPVNPEIITSMMESEARRYSPYYLSRMGDGVFVFGDFISRPGSDNLDFTQVISINHRADREHWNTVKDIKIHLPEETITVGSSTTYVKGKSSSVLNLSGCNGSRCFYKFEVYPNSGKVSQSSYNISGHNIEGNEVFTKRGFISSSDLSESKTEPDIEFSVIQGEPGEIVTSIINHPEGDYVRVEMHSMDRNGEISTQYEHVMRGDSSHIFKMPAGTTAFKVYMTDFSPPAYDRTSRRLIIYGDFHGY